MNEMLTAENIDENVMIFRITKYKPGMSLEQIYDLTRTCWKVSLNNARKAELAFAVYEGRVLEVFEIDEWVPGHSTPNCIPKSDELIKAGIAEGRWEFIGKIADDSIRDKYVGKDVSGFFRKGCQSPFRYIFKD